MLAKASYNYLRQGDSTSGLNFYSGHVQHRSPTPILPYDILCLARRRLNCKKNLVSRRQRQRQHIQKDLVTSEFVRVLNHEPVTINAFAIQEQRTSQIMPVCELTVRGRQSGSEAISMKAIGIENLGTLPNLSLPKALKEQGLSLADDRLLLETTQGRTPVDLLIGSDFYWKIVEPHIKTSNCGLTAVSSKFGWLLHGSTDGTPGTSTTSTCFFSDTLMDSTHPSSPCKLLTTSITLTFTLK